jgi:cell division protein FtsQ
MARNLIELKDQDQPGRDGPRKSAAAGEEISARAIDLDRTLDLDENEAQFLRTERRVPVRRGALPAKTVSWLKIGLWTAAVVVVCVVIKKAASSYAEHSWRFRIESSDNMEVSGVYNAPRRDVMDVAAADIGRNIFSFSLDERKRQLEQIPWVESATVMRLLPNRLAVTIHERTPVAFVQIGPRISLIDANGVVMGMPANRQTKYSFPVVHGITETEALSSRAAAMKIYNRLVQELDSGDAESPHGGMNYVRQLSEVDLSDPKDVKVTANDPGGVMVVHLGQSDFRNHFRLYVAHIAEWRQQFQNVQSVDLSFEGQVVVNPDRKRKPGEK